MKKLLALLFLTSLAVIAGLPPTSTKGVGDSSFLTTFQFDFANIPLTHSGSKATLGTIPISQGGTGATSRNFVLLAGDTMTGDLTVANSIKITHGTSSGANNIYVGAGNRNTGTTGFKNTIVGDNAGDSFITGADNTIFGYGAMQFAIGDANTAFGEFAGRSQVNGANNVYFGGSAGYSNSSGTRNHCFGDGCLYNNLANANTCMGWQCLVLNTTGTGNVALGQKAGYNNTTLSNLLWIANSDTGSGSKLITGDFANGKVGINVDPGSIDSTAALQIDSTTKSLVPPRMTTTQQNAITTPLAGSHIYNSSTLKPTYNDGTAWRGLVDNSSNETIAGTKTFSSTIAGSITGNAATVTTNANLTGEVTSVGNATTVTNSAVIGKVLTGYVSGAGTVAATDTILQAIQKLNANDATNANLTGPITSVGNATSIASQTGTGTKFVVDTSPTIAGHMTVEGVTATGATGTGKFVFDTSPALVTPALGTPTALVGTNITGTAASLTSGKATNIVGGLGGSIPYQTAVDTTALLANGTAGQFLKSNGTTLAPSWAATNNTSVVASKTGSYTLTTSDQIVYWDTSGGVGTATLPTAVGNSGLRLTIAVNVGGNLLTVNTTSAETIGGLASGAITMKSARDSLTVFSNGTNWSVTNMTPGAVLSPGSTGNVDHFSVTYGTTNATTVCSASPCSFLDQIGTAVSSVTRSATGSYTLNTVRTYLKLKCGVFPRAASNYFFVPEPISCSSCSSGTFTTSVTSGGALNDTYGVIMCDGSY